MKTDILRTDFKIENKNFPKNIYAIKIKDCKENTYEIAINHNGYCPDIYSEREQSNYNDYLSNLESSIVTEFFNSIGKKKPKSYYTILEVMTNNKGELYHFSKSVEYDKVIC
jgi:hypothetical protein